MNLHPLGNWHMDLKLIEDWINENDFSRMCEEAEAGDRHYAIFINKFMTELNALHFHLHNRSHDKKIQNQINKLEHILYKFRPKKKISRP